MIYIPFIIYTFIIYFLLINLVTSYRLLKTKTYSLSQKMIQMLMIWAIPVIGVLLVAVFLNQEPLKLNSNSRIKRFFLSFLWIGYDKLESKSGSWLGSHYVSDIPNERPSSHNFESTGGDI